LSLFSLPTGFLAPDNGEPKGVGWGEALLPPYGGGPGRGLKKRDANMLTPLLIVLLISGIAPFYV